ncbi:MAG: histidine phosphatase family protein [Microbacterium sp.]
MTSLVLVRHAKSDWGSPALDDHDRPLNGRGMRDAPAMARRLLDAGVQPQGILSSTALRAATTAGFFGDAFELPVRLDAQLYGAPASLLLRAAAQSPWQRVVVVAHDPGMSVLAGRLSGGGIAHMPTCAVATFHWDADDWDVATAVDPDRWTFDTPH